MAVDWITLPEPLWIKILQLLDVKTLLKTSETCKTFNNLLGYTILSDRLILYLVSPVRCQLSKELWNPFRSSNRSYKNITFSDYYSGFPETRGFLNAMIDILKQFSHCIKELHVRNFQISHNDFEELIEPLKYIELFSLVLSIFKEPSKLEGTEKIATKIDLLEMGLVTNDSQIDMFKKASVNTLLAQGLCTINFEQFLLKHKELQGLRVHGSKMFVNDNLSKVQFSLKNLDLFYTSWTNKQYAFNFIKTQTQLKSVYLRLAKDQYDILFLKHIINNNPNLVELVIALHDDSDNLFENDIHQLDTNYSVTQFYFNCSPKNPALCDIMYKLFPNNQANKHLFPRNF